MTGHEVATSFDGKLAYVPIYGDSSVGDPGTDGRELVVIDIGSRNVVRRFDFGHGVRPHSAVMNPNDGLLCHNRVGPHRQDHGSENAETDGNHSYWARRIAHACAFS